MDDEAVGAISPLVIRCGMKSDIKFAIIFGNGKGCDRYLHFLAFA